MGKQEIRFVPACGGHAKRGCVARSVSGAQIAEFGSV